MFVNYGLKIFYNLDNRRMTTFQENLSTNKIDNIHPIKVSSFHRPKIKKLNIFRVNFKNFFIYFKKYLFPLNASIWRV